MRDIIITSSVLILAVLLIRRLAKDRLAPVLQYALWLPVVFRLLLPVPLWSSPFSVLNLFPESRSGSGTAEEAADFPNWADEDKAESAKKESMEAGKNPDTGKAETENAGDTLNSQNKNMAGNAAGTNSAADTQSGQESHSVRDGGFGAVPEPEPEEMTVLPEGILSLTEFLPCIWLAGMLLVGGYMFFFQIKWQRYLRANRKPLTVRRKYRGKLSVYTVENLPSPCLSGRSIYLTEQMAEDPERLEHILAHEYCHYRQLDSLWVIVRCVLTVLYWFHPLVWVAAYVSKQDSELACDAAAIRLLGEKERLAYGETLLCLIAGNGQDRSRIGFVSAMSGREKGIRERILRIAGKPQYMVITAGAVLLLVAAVIAVTFSGTKGAQDAVTEGTQDLPAISDTEKEQDTKLEAQEAELQQLQRQVEMEMEAIEKQEAALEAQRAALEKEQASALEMAEREGFILKKLSSYDAEIAGLGSREGVYGIYGALNPSDYVQAYAGKGGEAPEEGMYLLETYKGPDSSDIKIYGMYTEAYGCEGIKILIGDDVSDFDEKWLMSYMNGMEGNLRLYESAEDGLPRTFAGKMLVSNTSGMEFWNLYLCDRYDTGTIELYPVRPEELAEQLRERLSFVIHAQESRIDVYDNGKMAGSIPVDASAGAMERISEVVVGEGAVSWELGGSEKEIRMITSVGLKLDTTEQIWYHGLPFLSVPVSCGSFGDRKTELGQASLETAYVNSMHQGADSLDQYLGLAEDKSQTEDSDAETGTDRSGGADASADILAEAFVGDGTGAHYDAAIQYTNPCPSYTGISNTFGVRTNLAAGEKKAHNGIDLAAEEGADVLAAADGTVYRTGFDLTSGNYVVLYHVMSGEFTYYSACQEILVTEGSSVTAGQKIATVGSTGRSTGPHLHFALSRDGEYIEPVLSSE